MANNIGIKSVTRPFWQDKRMSNAQFVEHLDQFLVKRFVAANSLTQWNIHHFVVANAHHDIALPLDDSLNGTYSRAAGKDAVVRGWAATTLQMAEDGNPHVEIGELFPYAVGIIECAAFRTLRDDDDATLLRFANTSFHETCQLVDTSRILRNDGSLGTTGDGTVLCQNPASLPITSTKKMRS